MHKFKKLILFFCLLFAAEGVSAANFTQPSCQALKDWASTLDPNKSYALYHGIEINMLFHDTVLICTRMKRRFVW